MIERAPADVPLKKKHAHNNVQANPDGAGSIPTTAAERGAAGRAVHLMPRGKAGLESSDDLSQNVLCKGQGGRQAGIALDVQNFLSILGTRTRIPTGTYPQLKILTIEVQRVEGCLYCCRPASASFLGKKRMSERD